MKFSSIELKRIAPLKPTQTGSDVFDFFNLHPGLCVAAVVDDAGRPIGKISRSEFLIRAAGLYGRAIYDNRSVASFMDARLLKVAESDEIGRTVRALEGDARLSLEDGFIVTDQSGVYLGIVDGLSVLEAMLDLNRSLIDDLKAEIAERQSAEERIRHLANSDPLTGLANRRLFMERVNSEVASGSAFSVLFIDLDRFKRLNDTFGHAMGDAALKTVAQRILGWAKGSLVARLGGDEFGVVCTGPQDRESLIQAARGLHARICQPILTSEGELDIGASVGAARLPIDAHSGETLIDAADRAMLRTKARGGGVCLFDRSQDTGAEARALRVTRLRSGDAPVAANAR